MLYDNQDFQLFSFSFTEGFGAIEEVISRFQIQAIYDLSSMVTSVFL